MKVYDRSLKQYIYEIEYYRKSLNFLYNTLPGRGILKYILVRPSFSKLGAKYYCSRLSVRKIESFVEKHSVDVSEWNLNSFNSFNDFFKRKKEITCTLKANELPCVADSRLTVFPISSELLIDVKHSVYSLEELIGKELGTDEYRNGNCLIFRLALDDYHRYLYPDDGFLKDSYTIKGELHTVRPVSAKNHVYVRNSRTVSYLSTEHFGEMIMIEVGALMIGKIVNNTGRDFKKGEEKGHFEYGGSTIILLTNKDVIIESDIIKQSEQGIETKVKIGTMIGRK